MIRTLKLTAGLIASMAFLFSIAEGVVASLCAPMQPVAGGLEVAAAETLSDDGPTGESSGMTDCGEDGSRDGGNNGESPCPFSPYASAQGCTSVASVAANCGQVGTTTTDRRLPIAFTGRTYENLVVARLYHPPRV